MKFKRKGRVEISLALVFVFLTLSVVRDVECGRILFFFGVSTLSHQILVWPLMEKLALRGHNVTLLTAESPKLFRRNSTVKIDIFSPQKVQNFMNTEFISNVDLVGLRRGGNRAAVWYGLPNFGVGLCKVLFQSEETQGWVNSSRFDLVVVDSLFNECALGLVYKFNIPFVYFSATSVFQWIPDALGFPGENSYVPDMERGYEQEMSFLERVATGSRALAWHLYRNSIMFPKLEDVLKKGLQIPFGSAGIPSLAEIERNASLVLLNTHFTTDYARSLPPLFVNVAGLHCGGAREPLPQDILDFIGTSGNEGFMYISFGTTTRVSKMSKEIQEVFFSSLGNSSSLRFIWKWDGSRPENMPKNVFTVNWVRQQDILAHPRIRGFISHAGLNSIHEAVYASVPLIVFPIFSEQDFNAEKLHRVGYGIRLEINTITQDEFQGAIKKITKDPKYSKRMEEISRLFRDRPDKPLETAVWWTEYILRNKETARELMRPLGAYQTWYERRMLDVWAFLVIMVLIPFIFIIIVFAHIVRKICQDDSLEDVILTTNFSANTPDVPIPQSSITDENANVGTGEDAQKKLKTS